MNILHVYKDYFPILGGIENHVRLLAEGQAGAGHQVTVLATNPQGFRTTLSQEHDVRVIRAGRLTTVASTPLSFALPWHLLHARPDLVHLHFPYPVGEISQWLLRRGRATVLTYHSDVVRQAKIFRLYRPLLRRVLQAVDAIVVGSPPMQKSAHLVSHQEKLHLIPYGIRLARFQNPPSPDEIARIRSRYLGRIPEGPRLIFVGRLRYYKGLEDLIAALADIPAHLIVVGSGPMLDEWQAAARIAGVTDRITWLGDVPDADLPTLYHAGDLFVLPASHPSEAFGLVQVEAMAAGLPVVCTELGTGTSYVNQDGVTGSVVPPRDPLALAAEINALLSNPERRKEMGAAAAERVAAEFDLQTMLARLMTLYEDLLAASH